MIIRYREGNHLVDCGIPREVVLQETFALIVFLFCEPVHNLNDYFVYHTGEGRLD